LIIIYLQRNRYQCEKDSEKRKKRRREKGGEKNETLSLSAMRPNALSLLRVWVKTEIEADWKPIDVWSLCCCSRGRDASSPRGTSDWAEPRIIAIIFGLTRRAQQ
jgi:hypothetical protein